jgi:hypothetical protein
MNVVRHRADETNAHASWRTAIGSVVTALLLVIGLAQPASAAPFGHGLFVFAGQTNPTSFSAPDSSGANAVGAPVNWRDLETADGVYNWTPLDNILSQAATAHKKVILRVYANADGFFAASPDWYFAKPGVLYYQTAFAASNGIKLPIPWDPIFHQEYGQFLTALGIRYNGNANIEFIQSIAAGGVYGEMLMAPGCGIGGGSACPPGYSAAVALASAEYWIDQHRTAFPNTNLAIMLNDLGGTLMADTAAYAVSKKFFLESNSPVISATTQALYNTYDDSTKIVMEVENGGCVNNTQPNFETQIINPIFGYGYKIDYLTFCAVAFTDTTTATYIHNTLVPKIRTNGPGGV